MDIFRITIEDRKWLLSAAVFSAGIILWSGCSRSRPQTQHIPDRYGMLKTALGMFDVDCGRYPTTTEGLEALLAKPSDSITNWQGPYLEKASELKDPWGHALIYRSPGIHNANAYDLYSMGPDGKDGAADDIVNWAVPGQ